jgi:hypothetical protein
MLTLFIYGLVVGLVLYICILIVCSVADVVAIFMPKDP